MIGKKNNQKILCFTLSCLICFPAISYAVTNLARVWRIPFISNLASPIVYGVFFTSLLLAIFKTIGKLSLGRLLITAFIMVSFLMTSLINRDAAKYMWTRGSDILYNPAYVFWLYSFSAFLLSDRLWDMQMFSQMFKRFSVMTIILALLQYIVALSQETIPEYMTFSYNILMPTVFLTIQNIQSRNWKTTVISVIGMLLVLIAGCRGALLGLLISLAIFILVADDITFKKKFFTITLSIIMCIVVAAFWGRILQGLVALLDTLKIPSRTVSLLAEESFFDDSGRGAILEKASSQIGIIGYGLYGDRILLRGGYVHNLVIELLVDYGFVLGFVIIVALLAVILKALRYADRESKVFMCALISIGVIKMMFSGSYLNKEPGLYLLLGICMNTIRQKSRGVTKNEDSTNQYG
ncbi:MAG: O-antigen ligase family protein [Oscillospiraceae bacterium]|nr:O-antigen ligase family protein [Oscillospiraceae bacterium]